MIVFSIPCTVAFLAVLASLNNLGSYQDILGLIAVSAGILGILIFYIFLYKYQIQAIVSNRNRWFFLAIHVASIMILFSAIIWLGFNSPWRKVCYWGSYDLDTAARSWIIAVIVIGTITLLGSFFDFLRHAAYKIFPHYHERFGDADHNNTQGER